MNTNLCKPDYHINIVYGGGCCISHYKEYSQTLNLFESEYSNNHMIANSSDWTDYNDIIQYQESKYYCMISNGCFIKPPKPKTTINNMLMSAYLFNLRIIYKTYMYIIMFV
jgi:hypothetical protein